MEAERGVRGGGGFGRGEGRYGIKNGMAFDFGRVTTVGRKKFVGKQVFAKIPPGKCRSRPGV